VRVLPAAIAAALLASTAAASESYDYVLHCAGCHKPDGSGSDAVPALEQVGAILSTPGGREYLARVPGVAQAPLSNRRLAELLNWLVPRFGNAEVQPPYGTDEVGELRTRPLRDPIAARQRLLARDPGNGSRP